MRSGHHTAYAKVKTASSHLSKSVLQGDIPQDYEMELTNGQWFCMSDAYIQLSIIKELNTQCFV